MRSRYRPISVKFNLFWGKILEPIKCSSGHVESSFNNPAGNLSLNVRKWWKTFIFFAKEIFHQNVPVDTWKAVFTSPPKNFLQQAEIVPPHFWKRWKTYNFSREKIFSKWFSEHKECRFDNTAEKLFEKKAENWNFFAQCPKLIEMKCIFFQKTILLKMFLWLHRM